MTGFVPQTSGFWRDRSTNWATTTAPVECICLMLYHTFSWQWDLIEKILRQSLSLGLAVVAVAEQLPKQLSDEPRLKLNAYDQDGNL